MQITAPGCKESSPCTGKLRPGVGGCYTSGFPVCSEGPRPTANPLPYQNLGCIQEPPSPFLSSPSDEWLKAQDFLFAPSACGCLKPGGQTLRRAPGAQKGAAAQVWLPLFLINTHYLHPNQEEQCFWESPGPGLENVIGMEQRCTAPKFGWDLQGLQTACVQRLQGLVLQEDPRKLL